MHRYYEGLARLVLHRYGSTRRQSQHPFMSIIYNSPD